jgi:hypothetical protein
VKASAGADVFKSDRVTMRLQADGQNLNNVFDVIDFGGLFSGAMPLARHKGILCGLR